jgi:anti-sigma regulatory factor (Ser/Thr protein kinase)/serine/threonine protein phosphatase PrpC
VAQDLKEAKPVEPVALQVAQLAQVKQVADVARGYAESLGFNSADCDEIALVVTELGSNLIRHAFGGTIKLGPVEAPGQVGIRVESEDSGPGIPDVEKALSDGFSTAGSLGIGLGTVNRLMDDLNVYSRSPSGVHLVSQRWVRPQRRQARLEDLLFGVATRSCRHLAENGDAFIIAQWERYALAGVIDGLGHGPFAQRASQTARRYLEQHFDQPLDSLFLGVQRACRATRGVVMALTRFDMAKKNITVASVGNVEVRLFGSPEHFSLTVRRGVIGLNAPNPVLLEHPWDPACVLIIHSDGLRTHWHWNDFPELALATPDAIAHRLLHALGKLEDDATVLVAKSVDPMKTLP